MNLTHPISSSSTDWIRLESNEPLGQQIGFGLVGIVLFSLFGFVAYAAGGELNGLQAFLAKGASFVFFALAVMALYGTIHVGLSARVRTPVLELSSMELTRGAQIEGRLLLKGPAKHNELSVRLVATQTDFEEVTRETLGSFQDDAPYETEDLVIDRDEKELTRIEVLSIKGVRIGRGDEVVKDFTIDVPNNAIVTGVTEISEFEGFSVGWRLHVECDILGPNNTQAFDVTVL
jgi:hypothetical protein